MSRAAARSNRSRGHVFHPTILREYDIRGIVGETLIGGRRAVRWGGPMRPSCARPAAGGSASASTAG